MDDSGTYTSVASSTASSYTYTSDKPGKWAATAIMTLMGASTVTPWLSYITAVDYFVALYPGRNILFLFPVGNMCVLLVGTCIMIFKGQSWALDKRLTAAMSTLLVLLCAVPLLDWLLHREGGALVSLDMSFYLTLLSQICCAACVSVYQSSLYGLAGVFGGPFVPAVVTGMGISGVGIVVIRGVTKAMFAGHPDGGRALSVYYFFGFSILVMASALLLYKTLRTLPYTKHQMERLEELRDYSRRQSVASSLAPSPGRRKRLEGSFAEASAMGPDSFNTTKTGIRVEKELQQASETSPLLKRRHQNQQQQQQEEGRAPSYTYVELSQQMHPSDTELGGVGNEPEVVVATAVAFKVMRMALSASFTFVVCLSCFPGQTTSLQSRTFGLGDWFPIILIGCYNIGDLIGKALPAWQLLLFTPRSLPKAVAMHGLFLPLFILTRRYAGADEGGLWTAILSHDLWPILLVLALGISTGYLGCLAMLFGPMSPGVLEGEKEMAGMIMSLFLIAGLCAGSWVGLLTLAVGA